MSNETSSGPRQRSSDGGRGGRRFYSRRRRSCQFCGDKAAVIDYKDVDLLTSFINPEGKIRPRRQTGTCAKHQRKVAVAVKRARHMALLPFAGESLS